MLRTEWVGSLDSIKLSEIVPTFIVLTYSVKEADNVAKYIQKIYTFRFVCNL